MYLRFIAIAIAIVNAIGIVVGIAMTFVEIQKIFERLFVTLPGKFKSA